MPILLTLFSVFFFFNDTATTEIYTLSLHDALPISVGAGRAAAPPAPRRTGAHAPRVGQGGGSGHARPRGGVSARRPDRRVRERPRAPGGAEVGAALAADLRRGRAADRHP